VKRHKFIILTRSSRTFYIPTDSLENTKNDKKRNKNQKKATRMPNRERRITWPPKGIYYFIVDQEWKIFELFAQQIVFLICFILYL
jgi:hypothetical protein